LHVHQTHGIDKVLRYSLAATVAFVIVEFVTGVQAQSLALLSDAGHNLADALALGLAWFGVWLTAKPADERKTFGYHRGGVLAAFVNALSLVVLSIYLLYESYERLLNPQPVREQTMMIVAGLGLLLNAGVLWALRRTNSTDLNIRAASIHMFGDALGSIAIVIGAILIHYTGWQTVDPVLSILISLLIVWSALDIVRDSLNILLEGLPKGMQLKDVTEAMREVPGILDVHDVHIWSLGSGAHALSCHALIADVPPSESGAILEAINHVLSDHFRIRHTTIQFEHVGCALAENGCCIQPVDEHEHHHAH
jgi:cobalt-zinc-cadmium efflux system protein